MSLLVHFPLSFSGFTGFVGFFRVLSSFLRSFLTNSHKSGISSGPAESREGVELLLLLCGYTCLLLLCWLGDWKNWSLQLCSQLRLLNSWISLPWFLGVKREENQLGSVLLETLNVPLERLHTSIASPVIHGDSDGSGIVLAKTSSVDFLQSEPTTGTNLGVVSDSWTTDYRAKRSCSWAWSNSAGLLESLRMTPDLAGRLIEPCLHVLLPILVEMAIGDHVIPFGRHGVPITNTSQLHANNSYN